MKRISDFRGPTCGCGCGLSPNLKQHVGMATLVNYSTLNLQGSVIVGVDTTVVLTKPQMGIFY